VFLIALWAMFVAGSIKVLRTMPYDNTTCGMLYNLAHGIVCDGIREPEGYNREEMAADELKDSEITDAPNLIMVMDESFSDPQQIADITTNKPIMPFYNSLTENTLKGNAVVSVYGGGTCNSEFEFLTGLSMADLPDGSYPYMQYVKNTVPTLVSDFSSEIYDKIYVHPYYGVNYNRSKIYSLLGFDSFEDIEDFDEDAETFRGYISDDAAFDKVIQNFENKPEGKKSLQFIVTIQNHSPYTENPGDITAEVKAKELNDHDLNSYLTLLNKSDKALEKLVNYFKSVDEPTAIVFFGDHRAMIAALNNSLKELDNVELAQHEVPFMIWTNYPSSSGTADTIGMNYLSLVVKEQLGLPLNSFDNARKRLMQSYPVRTRRVTQDSNGQSCSSEDGVTNEYRSLSYYHLFDYAK
jgi:phosphoglycerol transferase MdoB-like AlkP superfamily enzyme